VKWTKKRLSGWLNVHVADYSGKKIVSNMHVLNSLGSALFADLCLIVKEVNLVHRKTLLPYKPSGEK